MFQIQFWGVRGSVATAGVENARVGGNTSCVEVQCGTTQVVLDAGTGLRALGAEMVQRARETQDVHLFLSHYHWDHIQGFPFFGPAYLPGNRVTVHGRVEAGQGNGAVRGALDAQMQSPHFPVGLDAMRAELVFRGVRPGGDVLLPGDVQLRAAEARHPNGCLAYRIEHAGRSVVFATDTEHDPEAGAVDARLCALARDADVLIYDAQYTPDEYAGKRGWGHSTAEEGARLADAAGVKQLVLFHHDPGHDDWAIARIEAVTRGRRPEALAARERMVVDVEALGAPRARAA